MRPDDSPKTNSDLIAAIADGELDLLSNPDALTQIAQDAQAGQRIACQQQLKQACAKAMESPEMTCPDELVATLRAMGVDDALADPAGPANPSPALSPASYAGPPVIARIGRWAPAAVAAVLLIAAGVLFTQANTTAPGINTAAASYLTVDQVQGFTGRHNDCANDMSRLKQAETFGDASEFDQLPGKLGNYFNTSTNGINLNLDGIGYDYQLTGTCALPGKGAVHIVYRSHDDPTRAISVWVKPAGEEHADLQPDRVYVEAGADLERPVIFWRDGGLLYYLVGDSLEDCDKAVKELRQAA